MREINIKMEIDVDGFDDMNDTEKFNLIDEMINIGSEAINADSKVTEIAISTWANE